MLGRHYNLVTLVKYVKFCHTRYRKKPMHGSRYLVNAQKVFEFNAWDDVEWDDEQEAEAKRKVVSNSSVKLDYTKAETYERNASKHWNEFYNIHSNRFFKDRHWLFTEFPELNFNTSDSDDSCTKKVFEVGCGVGNTVFPILQYSKNREVFVYCCDFSSQAIDLLRENPNYDTERCNAFVLDATDENWNVPFEDNSLDIVVLIFVLCAIKPERFAHIMKKLYQYIKPGGKVLFRDYGRYDLAQLRFKAGQCLDENFYVRGDGTRVYFFTEEEVRHLFEGAGFVKEEVHVDRRLQVNRGRMLKMYRVWIQAKYKKPL
ncbi:hypothetical protein RI129_010071 [Pyrocoelia pectoralis]|uniref:tRNA N(3)-methylcytidine methyltransferase n=1 Tax=Pyrocoelia pectoralis TaxID=417401 RepID=A0AAN7VDS1_9COLE